MAIDIVSFPIENRVIFHSYVKLPEGSWFLNGKGMDFRALLDALARQPQFGHRCPSSFAKFSCDLMNQLGVVGFLTVPILGTLQHMTH